MIIEVNKKYIKQFGTVQNAVKEGYCIEWNLERITNAFNCGNGTMKDLKRYIRDNSKICMFINA